MAQTKTKNRPRKQAASRYYVVRKIQDVRKNAAERVENYHQAFIKDPVESGKAFVEDLRDDPRKALDNLVDESRRLVGDLKKDAGKKVNGVVADGRKLYQKARKNPRKTVVGMVDDGRDFAEDLLEDGKSIMKGIEKDARIALDEFVDSGKKALDNLPGKKKFQKTIEKRIQSVPAQFNLPTRKDMDMLMDRLEGLNTKIDTLGKEFTA
jgi:polyhydroxyalkanoate synthesis regulator phasin